MGSGQRTNPGFIGYLTDNAEAIVAAGEGQRMEKRHVPLFVGIWLAALGLPTTDMLPDGLWPLGVVVGVAATALGVQGRRMLPRHDRLRRFGWLPLLGGLYLIGLAVEKWLRG